MSSALEHLDYPTRFTFRVVAVTHHSLVERYAELVRDALGRAPEQVTAHPSRQGRWQAVRLVVEVRSADEVLAVYAALSEAQGVVMTL